MFILKLISRLPFEVLYGLSNVLFFLSFYVARYRRRMVRRNIRNSFPDKSKQALYDIEKAFYRNLSDYAVETIKLLTISKEELFERYRFTNVSVIDDYKKEGKSVLILAAHQFNWEWLLAAGNLALPLPVDFVYQKVNSQLGEDFSLRCRTRFGAYPIKRDEVAREIIKRKTMLRAIAIVADQYPGYEKDKKYHTTFLHQDTVFFMAANQLAVMTQYPSVFASVKKIRRGYYETTFIKIGEPPYSKDSEAVVKNYVVEVEKSIREEPEGWLWSHNRWKTRHLQ